LLTQLLKGICDGFAVKEKKDTGIQRSAADPGPGRLGDDDHPRMQLLPNGGMARSCFCLLRDGRTLGRKKFEELRAIDSRLTLRRMFETAVADGADELRLEQEVAETGRVNTNIAALFIDVGGGGGLALLSVGSGGSGGGGALVATDLLVGVVNEILLVRHGEGVDQDGAGAKRGVGLSRWCLRVT
jgi:hypothetical protein